MYREYDKVTRWIRDFYSPYVHTSLFEVNIAFARLINKIETLGRIGYIQSESCYGDSVLERLLDMQAEGAITFGNAYIVSTNGRTIGKAQYICETLLPAIHEAVGPAGRLGGYPSNPTLAGRYSGLMSVHGLGSFMAGQILADLKNTPGHPLFVASDKRTWSCPGPGSLRGLAWIFFGGLIGARVIPSQYAAYLLTLRGYLENTDAPQVDDQDLQNCLCEFDKYMRVSTGAGRSKRRYNGVN